MGAGVTDTCAGACCAVFPLHLTSGLGAVDDLLYILSMLVPLTREQAAERYARLGYGELIDYGPDYDLFTCRHWDEQTRLCTAYDQRPAMCRDYPYEGRSCERGCGYALSQADSDRIANSGNKGWRWDVEGQGWRPRSNGDWQWDEERGMLVQRGTAA